MRSALVAGLSTLHLSHRWASSPSSSSLAVKPLRQSWTCHEPWLRAHVACQHLGVFRQARAVGCAGAAVQGVQHWPSARVDSHLYGQLSAGQQGQGQVLEDLVVVARVVAGAAAQGALQLPLKQVADDTRVRRSLRLPCLQGLPAHGHDVADAAGLDVHPLKSLLQHHGQACWM